MTPLRLFILATPILLAACSSTPSPLMTEPLRPGVDQSAPATETLPRGTTSRSYDASVVPANEERGSKVGSVVAGSGGQKAQKEKDLKEQSALEVQRARELQEQAHQQNSDEKTSSQ